MEKVIINSYEDFEKLVGRQIGVSDYVELPQERITSGFMWNRNVLKWRAPLKVP